MGLKQRCQIPEGKQHTNLSLLSLHPLLPFSVLTILIMATCDAAKACEHLQAKQLFSERLAKRQEGEPNNGSN